MSYGDKSEKYSTIFGIGMGLLAISYPPFVSFIYGLFGGALLTILFLLLAIFMIWMFWNKMRTALNEDKKSGGSGGSGGGGGGDDPPTGTFELNGHVRVEFYSTKGGTLISTEDYDGAKLHLSSNSKDADSSGNYTFNKLGKGEYTLSIAPHTDKTPKGTSIKYIMDEVVFEHGSNKSPSPSNSYDFNLTGNDKIDIVVKYFLGSKNIKLFGKIIGRVDVAGSSEDIILDKAGMILTEAGGSKPKGFPINKNDDYIFKDLVGGEKGLKIVSQPKINHNGVECTVDKIEFLSKKGTRLNQTNNAIDFEMYVDEEIDIVVHYKTSGSKKYKLTGRAVFDDKVYITENMTGEDLYNDTHITGPKKYDVWVFAQKAGNIEVIFKGKTEENGYFNIEFEDDTTSFEKPVLMSGAFPTELGRIDFKTLPEGLIVKVFDGTITSHSNNFHVRIKPDSKGGRGGMGAVDKNNPSSFSRYNISGIPIHLDETHTHEENIIVPIFSVGGGGLKLFGDIKVIAKDGRGNQEEVKNIDVGLVLFDPTMRNIFKDNYEFLNLVPGEKTLKVISKEKINHNGINYTRTKIGFKSTPCIPLHPRTEGGETFTLSQDQKIDIEIIYESSSVPPTDKYKIFGKINGKLTSKSGSVIDIDLSNVDIMIKKSDNVDERLATDANGKYQLENVISGNTFLVIAPKNPFNHLGINYQLRNIQFDIKIPHVNHSINGIEFDLKKDEEINIICDYLETGGSPPTPVPPVPPFNPSGGGNNTDNSNKYNIVIDKFINNLSIVDNNITDNHNVLNQIINTINNMGMQAYSKEGEELRNQILIKIKFLFEKFKLEEKFIVELRHLLDTLKFYFQYKFKGNYDDFEKVLNGKINSLKALSTSEIASVIRAIKKEEAKLIKYIKDVETEISLLEKNLKELISKKDKALSKDTSIIESSKILIEIDIDISNNSSGLKKIKTFLNSLPKKIALVEIIYSLMHNIISLDRKKNPFATRDEFRNYFKKVTTDISAKVEQGIFKIIK